MSRTGILFILIGASGAGKNTLMKRVQKQLGDLPQLATENHACAPQRRASGPRT